MSEKPDPGRRVAKRGNWIVFALYAPAFAWMVGGIVLGVPDDRVADFMAIAWGLGCAATALPLFFVALSQLLRDKRQ